MGYGRSTDCLAPPRVDERGVPDRVPAPARSRRRQSDDLASQPSLEISNAIVHLYKEAFGRGPTKVRTTFAGPDMVLVLLEDALTVTEHTLLALGEIDALRDSRLVLQQALEEAARSVVEAVLGRQTLAFITATDPRRGVAVNVFTLKPSVAVDRHQDKAALRAGAA
jgi:uncharacterized protein YbcI